MKKTIKYGIVIFVLLAIIGSAMNKTKDEKETVETTEAMTTEEVTTTKEVTTTEEATTTEEVTTTEEATTTEEVTTTEETTTTEEVATIEQTTEIHTSSYVLNTNTMKAHVPSCSSVNKIKEGNRKDVESDPETLTKQGYSPCGNCRPW